MRIERIDVAAYPLNVSISMQPGPRQDGTVYPLDIIVLEIDREFFQDEAASVEPVLTEVQRTNDMYISGCRPGTVHVCLPVGLACVRR